MPETEATTYLADGMVNILTGASGTSKVAVGRVPVNASDALIVSMFRSICSAAAEAAAAK